MEAVPSLPDDVLEVGKALIPRPVFLVGCARSGTSILGEALAEHPRIAYLFEASEIWNELVPDRPDHRLEAKDATPELAREIYRTLAEAYREAVETGETVVRPGEARNEAAAGGSSAAAGAGPPGRPAGGAGPTDALGPAGATGPAGSPEATAAGAPAPDVLLEKNPKHVIRIPFLAALFPHAKFIHILRDGRDTVASLMFRNRGSRWGHLETPGWRALLEAHPEKNHIRCAHQWRDSVRIARQDARALDPSRYREVRYEDLLSAPRETVGGLLELLGLDPDPAVEAFLPRIQDATAGSYHAKRQVRHYVENHARRVGRYEENLTPAQIAEVEEVCGGLLRELGYETSGDP